MTAADLPGEDGLDDRVPFLMRLEKSEREALLALGRELQFKSRDTLLRQHEPSAYVLFVTHGWTKVTAAAANGYEALLALRGPGDIVGESAVLTGRARSATVTALEAVQAVAVDREKFTGFLTASPAVAYKLLGLTSDRMRAADRRRLEFASMSVKERLAVLLMELANTNARYTAAGVELGVPLSKQELAGSVGASREMVQRLLKDLRARGVVVTGRRTLRIVRMDVLRQIARSKS